MQNELIATTRKLREKLTEYRYSKKSSLVSVHVNALDIAVSLTEYGIEKSRAIRTEERAWFEAGRYVHEIFPSSSQWYELSLLYGQLIEMVEQVHFFEGAFDQPHEN